MSDTEIKEKKDKKFKFNNGWTAELEKLAADWADRAQCYRWMHDKSHKKLALYNQYMMIPVIILSTLAGTANFGLDTIFPDPASQNKKIATLGIGSVGILTGIITTLANFFRFAQLSEAHSGAAISWAKFSRLIIIELSLHPNERSDAFTFLKMFRVELDRLIEQSPVIPEFIVKQFNKEFDTKIDIKRPEITGAIEHTHVYDNRNERLKQVAVEAALAIAQKKKLLRDLALADIDKRIHQIVEARPYAFNHNRDASVTSYIPTNASYVPTTKHVSEHKYEKPNPRQEIAQTQRGNIGELRRNFSVRNTEEAKFDKKTEPGVDAKAKAAKAAQVGIAGLAVQAAQVGIAFQAAQAQVQAEAQAQAQAEAEPAQLDVTKQTQELSPEVPKKKEEEVQENLEEQQKTEENTIVIISDVTTPE